MRNYKGKKNRGGMSAGQVGVLVLILMVAIMAMTIHVNAQMTGMSAGEQIHQALFVAKDWD